MSLQFVGQGSDEQLEETVEHGQSAVNDGTLGGGESELLEVQDDVRVDP